MSLGKGAWGNTEDDAMKKWVIGMAAALAMTLALPANAADGIGLRGKPAKAMGRLVGKSVGVFGWESTADKLHFRVTGPKGKNHKVDGRLCTFRKLAKRSLQPVRLEKREDKVRIGPKGHCIFFNFRNHGGIDGFDFKTGAKVIALHVRVDGREVDTSKFHIGRNNRQPLSNPGVLVRPKPKIGGLPWKPLRPKAKPKGFERNIGKVAGVFGWESTDGQLHFRVTGSSRSHKVAGKVCALGKIERLEGKRLERRDRVKLGPKGHCISFGFVTHKHVDGFDFRTNSPLLTVHVTVDGKSVAPDKIHLGQRGRSPKFNPAIVLRRRSGGKSGKNITPNTQSEESIAAALELSQPISR